MSKPLFRVYSERSETADVTWTHTFTVNNEALEQLWARRDSGGSGGWFFAFLLGFGAGTMMLSFAVRAGWIVL